MEQSNEATLWKRVWRTQDGVVFSTRPYATEEDLLKSEPADGRWCGDPFSFVADDFSLADFQRCEANDRKRKELFDSQSGMCACCGEPLERSFNMQPVTPPRLVRIECVSNGSALLRALL